MKLNVVHGCLVNVSLVGCADRPLDLYLHYGRHFVEAKDLMEYRIKVRGHAYRRIEVLTAVDGRNTLKDEPAHLTLSRGMVINGYSTYDVTGWRIDDSHTRPFIFTVLDEETVAKQATGSSENLGVIAVAAYREYVRPIHFEPYRFDYTRKGGFESLSMLGVGVGTGMGGRLDHDAVGHTTFERDTSSPEDVIEIYAMPAWWLKREGVIPSHESIFPSGFAGGNTGYERFKKI